MIEGLIEFAEETVFSRIGKIVDSDQAPPEQCRAILLLLLSFCETNPGFARLFAGDALQGETERLRHRMRQFYDRIENPATTTRSRVAGGAHNGAAARRQPPPPTCCSPVPKAASTNS